ncbi:MULTISPECIES: alpha/beta hydrolase [unclassified Brevibacterium]|uniref:alpha/beta fold hydrolase n=1 Tax=unclassified Brevibacterium TaxID=2614124 RepID=UPI001E282843|nr:MULTISPECIES: alpha/beta hydrolase [unclassified Brevibacterium]MCD1285556.1 alpha/beta hydrolase [Brevibacterium sp. CCUG 69071]MDK8434610.1 alpha/beta hydrolase [Brevibacterium sp. H-BE7]
MNPQTRPTVDHPTADRRSTACRRTGDRLTDAEPTSPRTRIRLRDGTKVATEVIGPPESDDRLGDIVICHGTPWSSRMWRPLAHELGQSYRVHLWDMPGYGESIPGGGFTDHPPAESAPAEAAPAEAIPALPEPPAVDLVTQGRRLAELLEVWKLESPHVIAHDIGGAVALGAHLFDGREFASLYLLDIVTLDPWGSPFFRLVAENEPVFAALPAPLHRALVREYIAGAASSAPNGPRPEIFRLEVPRLEDSRLELSHLDDLADPWCSPAGQSAFYRQVASLSPRHTQGIADSLGEVRCPVHIGWGEDDPWIPVEQAERLAKRLPGYPGITRFPGAGHLVPLESPEEFAADIRSWFSSRSVDDNPVASDEAQAPDGTAEAPADVVFPNDSSVARTTTR